MSSMSESDYNAIVSHARYLTEIYGWDMETLFEYLEKPWKWTVEREWWLEKQREPKAFDEALADSLQSRQLMDEARRLK